MRLPSFPSLAIPHADFLQTLGQGGLDGGPARDDRPGPGLKSLQGGLLSPSLFAHVGDTQRGLRPKLAGFGPFDEPCQIDEWRNPNRARLQTGGQLVEEPLTELGR
jgi:hypothetical protein